MQRREASVQTHMNFNVNTITNTLRGFMKAP